MILAARVGRAHTNYMTAIKAAAVEILLTKESGWGFAATVLTQLIELTVIGSLVGGLARMRKGAIQALSEAEFRAALGGGETSQRLNEIAARVSPEQVKASLSGVSRGVTAAVKDGAKRLPSDAASKADFLALLADSADSHAAAIVETVPASLDDDGLLLLLEAYAQPDHAPSVYAKAIADILARYKSSEVGAVGIDFGREHSPDHPMRQGRLDVVRFVAAGAARHALVEQRHTLQRQDDPEPGAVRPTDAKSLHAATWVRWVDDDLAPAAIAAHTGRTGDVLVVDLGRDDVPDAMASHVLAWITGTPWARGREVAP
jgi:hypothetical protein